MIFTPAKLVNEDGKPIDTNGVIISNKSANVLKAVCLVNTLGYPVDINGNKLSNNRANVWKAITLV